jgi:hypothetical protein
MGAAVLDVAEVVVETGAEVVVVTGPVLPVFPLSVVAVAASSVGSA